MKNSKLTKCLTLLFLSFLLCGCSVYRDAAIQGASDVGTIAGTTLGVPLGIAAVTIDESINTTGDVLKHPRLYERYPSQPKAPKMQNTYYPGSLPYSGPANYRPVSSTVVVPHYPVQPVILQHPSLQPVYVSAPPQYVTQPTVQPIGYSGSYQVPRTRPSRSYVPLDSAATSFWTPQLGR